MYIGQKIKELREARRMTLTELSLKSTVQLATLSRMENLKMTGTLESHINIARALEVGLAELYSNITTDDKRIDQKDPRAKTDIFLGSGKSSYEILTAKVLSKKMMPILLKIEPGGKTNLEQNPIGSEKFIFILDGKIEAHVENDTYSLSRHNTLYFDASLSHYFVNAGQSAARVICVGTPVVL